jgi:Skp family chaperone for outer membrane proteins
MKKYFLLVLIVSFFNSTKSNAQVRGIKIGYIDMEYILEKTSSYAEAKNQLEQKAEKWKQEIEVKKSDIAKLKEALKTEKVLLTKELIEEREAEIAFQENELSEYQQKKFGPNGELIVQKALLIKPIQDQVFNAVQDLAESRKYDYIFDKSSDLTMLFAAKKHDLSERVIQVLSRSEKREQLSKKQQKIEEEKQKKEEMLEDNPELSEKQRLAEERKAARLKMIEDKKIAAEEKRAAAEAKRKQQLEEKTAKKNGTVSAKTTTDTTSESTTDENTNVVDKKTAAEEKKAAAEEKRAAMEAARKKTLEERQKALEERKKAAEEKRLKIIADREAAKKAKEEANKKP